MTTSPTDVDTDLLETDLVDTDLLDAVLAAGPKAERFLASLIELRERLARGPLTDEDRYDLGADMVADAAVLTAVAAQTFHGMTR